jgi:sugar-specific transcriptional regulator TrmB
MNESVRQFLALDRSLTSSDRKVLEHLLLHPHAASVRELARATGSNVQSLYTALDRLEQRGLLLRERGAAGMTFRACHPSAVIHELLRDSRQAGELAVKVEEPLRRIHEGDAAEVASRAADRAFVTGSLTACLGSMLHQMRSVRNEVWIIGSESPWCSVSPALESELVGRGSAGSGAVVRVLVRDARGEPDRQAVLRRLRAAGVPVRYSELFSTPMVLLDQRWLFAQMGSGEPNSGTGETHFLRLDAPELVADLARSCAQAWSRGSPGSDEGTVAGRGTEGFAPRLRLEPDSGRLVPGRN